ncbi:MAG TPA: histidine kinase, partial [Bacteroidota bacterium]|nr:histidine kinase [Bacteroidota bacterium]
MKRKRKTYEELDREIRSLRSRLEEAEQALGAIRTGEIDTLVVSGKRGEQVYTLKGADHSYRVLLEGLNEAALTLTADGTILYCNGRFAEMTKTSPGQLLGSFVQSIIKPAERKMFGRTLRQSTEGPIRREFCIRAADRSNVPALFSIKNMELEGVTAFCMVVTDISERKRTEEALQQSEQHFRRLFLDGQRMQNELRRLSREVLRVQELERTRISREIHDEIGQALTAISLILKRLETNGKPSEVKKNLQSAQQIVEKAMDFIHVFSHRIHPSMLEDLGLFSTLRSYVREFQKSTGMRVHLKLKGEHRNAGIEQKVAIFRIVQESLTNVLKHSGTHTAEVIVRKFGEGITLQIADNGRGFTTDGTAQSGRKRQGLG